MFKYITAILLLFTLISCNNSNTSGDENGDSSITPPYKNLPPPTPITFTVDAVYPHDPEAFTQGLSFYDGKLYE